MTVAIQKFILSAGISIIGVKVINKVFKRGSNDYFISISVSNNGKKNRRLRIYRRDLIIFTSFMLFCNYNNVMGVIINNIIKSVSTYGINANNVNCNSETDSLAPNLTNIINDDNSSELMQSKLFSRALIVASIIGISILLSKNASVANLPIINKIYDIYSEREIKTNIHNVIRIKPDDVSFDLVNMPEGSTLVLNTTMNKTYNIQFILNAIVNLEVPKRANTVRRWYVGDVLLPLLTSIWPFYQD